MNPYYTYDKESSTYSLTEKGENIKTYLINLGIYVEVAASPYIDGDIFVDLNMVIFNVRTSNKVKKMLEWVYGKEHIRFKLI